MDQDFGLVSDKILIHNNGLIGWGQGPGKYSQKKTHLWRSPSENELFVFSNSTTRLAESVEVLNSSLAQSPGKLYDCKALHETWFPRDSDVVFTSVRTPFFKLLSMERNLFLANI